MPKSKRLKLIIDTNLWISFIISNKQNLLDPLLFAEEVRLLFSTELFAEPFVMQGSLEKNSDSCVPQGHRNLKRP